MNHIMHLPPKTFEQIRRGEKTIETRLHDKKRRQLAEGDTITFLKRPANKEQLQATITNLDVCGNFKQLLDRHPLHAFGTEDKDAYLTHLRSIYSKEEEDEYGVVGITIKKT